MAVKPMAKVRAIILVVEKGKERQSIACSNTKTTKIAADMPVLGPLPHTFRGRTFGAFGETEGKKIYP